MIDVGAYSSRPGAAEVTEEEETERLLTACRAVRSVAPDIPLSVDTFRAEAARIAVEDGGADIVNDITGGEDPGMLPTVARLGVPYIAMHMRGTPATMQTLTRYPDDDPTGEIISRLSDVIERCSLLGIADVIADPGLGFAKTLEQNYRVLRHIPLIAEALGRPILIGLSRKSMLTKALGIAPEDAQFTIRDVLDIALAALLLFYIYRIMRESGTINIFYGLLAFIVVWVVASQILEMKLIGTILDKFMSIGLLVIVILFQDQIKRFLVELGDHKRWRFLRKLFHHRTPGEDADERGRRLIIPIVYACMNMAKSKTGALIVIQQNVPLENYERSGDIIDALPNSRLIENIFFKNSPLHDGALIVADDRLKSAGCILPVSHDRNVPRALGLRHRSALGISQATDAIAIVVSEETGGISIAHRGRLTTRLSSADLEHNLTQILHQR